MLPTENKLNFICFISILVINAGKVRSIDINLEPLCYEIANRQNCLAHFEMATGNELAKCTFYITPDTLPDTDWNDITQKLSQVPMKIDVNHIHDKMEDQSHLPKPNIEPVLPQSPLTTPEFSQPIIKPAEETSKLLEMLNPLSMLPKETLEKLKMNTKLKELQEKLEKLKKEKLRLKNEKLMSIINKIPIIKSTDTPTTTPNVVKSTDEDKKVIINGNPLAPTTAKTTSTQFGTNTEPSNVPQIPKTMDVKASQNGGDLPKQNVVSNDATKDQNVLNSNPGKPVINIPNPVDPVLGQSSPKINEIEPKQLNVKIENKEVPKIQNIPEKKEADPNSKVPVNNESVLGLPAPKETNNGNKDVSQMQNIKGNKEIGFNSQVPIINEPILEKSVPKAQDKPLMTRNNPQLPNQPTNSKVLEKTDEKDIKQISMINAPIQEELVPQDVKQNQYSEKDTQVVEQIIPAPVGSEVPVEENIEQGIRGNIKEQQTGAKEIGKVDIPIEKTIPQINLNINLEMNAKAGKPIIPEPIKEMEQDFKVNIKDQQEGAKVDSPIQEELSPRNENQNLYSEKDTQVVEQDIPDPAEMNMGQNFKENNEEGHSESIVGQPVAEFVPNYEKDQEDQRNLEEIPQPKPLEDENINQASTNADNIDDKETISKSNNIEKNRGDQLKNEAPKTLLEQFKEKIEQNDQIGAKIKTDVLQKLKDELEKLEIGHSNLESNKDIVLKHEPILGAQLSKIGQNMHSLSEAQNNLKTHNEHVKKALKQLKLKAAEKQVLPLPTWKPLPTLPLKKLSVLPPLRPLVPKPLFKSPGLTDAKLGQPLLKTGKEEQIQDSKIEITNPILHKALPVIPKVAKSQLIKAPPLFDILGSQNGDYNNKYSQVLVPTNIEKENGDFHSVISFQNEKGDQPMDLDLLNQQNNDNVAIVNLPNFLDHSVLKSSQDIDGTILEPNFNNDGQHGVENMQQEAQVEHEDEKIKNNKNAVDLFPYYSHHKNDLDEMEGLKYLFGDYSVWGKKRI